MPSILAIEIWLKFFSPIKHTRIHLFKKKMEYKRLFLYYRVNPFNISYLKRPFLRLVHYRL